MIKFSRLQDENKYMPLYKLNILLKHFQLGEDHLKNQLGEKLLKDFFLDVKLTNEQIKNIKPNKIGEAGNIALVFNSFLSSLFGTYLGLASYIDFGFVTIGQFIILLSATALIGAYFGYSDYRSNKNDLLQTIKTLKIYNAQHIILTKMIQSIKRSAQKNETYLNQAVHKLNSKYPSLETYKNNFSFPQHTDIWYNELTNEINDILKKYQSNNRLIIACCEEIKECMKIIQSFIYRYHWTNDSTLPPESHHYIDLLSNHTPQFNIQIKKNPWWHNHIEKIFVGLLPTAIGTFSVLLFYFSVIPKAMGHVGAPVLKSLLTDPVMKNCELALGILLAIYFGITFIINYKKSSCYGREKEAMLLKINKLSISVMDEHTRLNVLRNMKSQISKIALTAKILQTMCSRAISLRYESKLSS